MKLVIDSRERKIIDILLRDGHDFITNNLPVGDIILCDDDGVENIESTSVLDHASAIYDPNESLAVCARKYIIIERKTLDDLASSIVDGRYREQKHRLIATSMAEKCDILYIIEGVLSSSKNSTSSRGSSKKSSSPTRTVGSNVLFGAVISTMMRDGIKIVQTKNPETTVDFILQLKKRYEEKSIFPVQAGEKINDDHAVAVAQQLQHDAREIAGVKKENMTKEIFFMVCLISLPGISSLTAKAIIKKYSSMSQIYGDGKEIVYDNIRNITTSNGRRIGDKKALTLVEYFFD